MPITSAKYFTLIVGYSHSKIPLVFHEDFTIFCEGVKDNGNAVCQQLFGLGKTGFIVLMAKLAVLVTMALSAATITSITLASLATKDSLALPAILALPALLALLAAIVSLAS